MMPISVRISEPVEQGNVKYREKKFHWVYVDDGEPLKNFRNKCVRIIFENKEDRSGSSKRINAEDWWEEERRKFKWDCKDSGEKL
jgi:hypothetical protein